MSEVENLWISKDPLVWQGALTKYWTFVKKENVALEKEMDQLDASSIQTMSAAEWFDFLLFKYFRWKYTAPNRYPLCQYQ
jgi:hypothetical protein